MKNSRLSYVVITGLMAVFMLMASVPDLLRVPQAGAVFVHLGYPIYLLPFLGAAKILGVIVVLVAGNWRLTEWAYAGLVFDLVGALYSHLSLGDPPGVWAFPVIGLVLVAGSYVLRRPRIGEKGIVRPRDERRSYAV